MRRGKMRAEGSKFPRSLGPDTGVSDGPYGHTAAAYSVQNPVMSPVRNGSPPQPDLLFKEITLS